MFNTVFNVAIISQIGGEASRDSNNSSIIDAVIIGNLFYITLALLAGVVGHVNPAYADAAELTYLTISAFVLAEMSILTVSAIFFMIVLAAGTIFEAGVWGILCAAPFVIIAIMAVGSTGILGADFATTCENISQVVADCYGWLITITVVIVATLAIAKE